MKDKPVKTVSKNKVTKKQEQPLILPSGLSEVEKLAVRVTNLEKAFNELLKVTGARFIAPDETAGGKGEIRYGG